MGHDTGRMGFGAVPGLPIEGWLFKNFVHGCFVKASTTGSSQLTGAGNGTYLYDISDGILVVDGTSLNKAAAADAACEGVADIQADGYSKVYLLIAWKHPTTGVVAFKVIPGTAALTGAQVAATTAEVEAGLVAGSKWVAIGTMTIARTGATTVTEAVDNTVRPLCFAT